MTCPECGEPDTRTVHHVSRYSGDRFVTWECCGQDVRCEHGNEVALCVKRHGEP